MKNSSSSFLDDIAEGIDTAAILSLFFPLIFPAIAFFDGARTDYIELSIFCMVVALLIVAVLMTVLTTISGFLSDISTERTEDTKAFHAYLLDGGKI